MCSWVRKFFAVLGRCLRKDDRVHVPVPAPPLSGNQKSDKDDLLSLAMRTQAILEKSMPRAHAEKIVHEKLKSAIRARQSGTERPIRG